MIEAPAKPRAKANPSDLNDKIKVAPYTDRPPRVKGEPLGPPRPEGEMDPAFREVARHVRAQIAGVGSDDFFKNVAVARVRVGPNGPVRYIAVVNTPARHLGKIKGGLDSEQLLLQYVQGRNNERVSFILEALYTERAPCMTCTDLLAKPPYSEIPIFYSVVDETYQTGWARAQELRVKWGL